MSECVCSHDSDLHELEDVAFIDGAERDDCIRLRWRWHCSGAVGVAGGYEPLPCSCTNFKLSEVTK